jgi:hypothetical protein
MPDAMNPPLGGTLIFLRWEPSYITFLWKNSVSAAFYAVFFIQEPKKPTNIMFFAIPRRQMPLLSSFGGGSEELASPGDDDPSCMA